MRRPKTVKERDNKLRPSSLRRKRIKTKTRRTSDPPIPLDLTVEILTRLPVKSLVRFQRLSEPWSFIIRSSGFARSYDTLSSTRPPRLLFTFRDVDRGWRFFFSALHSQNPDEESSCVARSEFSIYGFTCVVVSPSVRGLICCRVGPSITVCNPSAGLLVTLPKVEPDTRSTNYIFFGFDPIKAHYKVLCLMKLEKDDEDGLVLDQWHRVFTLGVTKTWRNIVGCISHYPETDGLCINGVVYYGAWTSRIRRNRPIEDARIMSFDVGSEKFNLIANPGGALIQGRRIATLIEYRGKLAGVCFYGFYDTNRRFDLWVLEDAGNQEWSKKICVLPPRWRDLVGKTEVRICGATGSGEIIFVHEKISKPPYVFYCNLEKNSIRKVEITGPYDDRIRDGLVLQTLVTPDHVESIMLLQDRLLFDK